MRKILLLVALVQLTFYSIAQITIPVIKANFGVEADLSANFYNNAPTAAVDDWFNNYAIGTGKGIIDTTGAAAILAGYITNPATRKSSFNRLMAFPPYTLVNNRLVLDAVYHRDYHGDDSTVFGAGSNKNGMSPADWASPGPASIPDKNDILDAYVHVRRAGPNARDSLWMFAALSLENTTGNRFFDFELYQTDITFNYATRNFTGYGPDAGHTTWKFDAAGNIVSPGDIIFTAEFSSSSLTLVEARIWIDRSSLSMTPAAFNWGGLFDGASSGSRFGYASIRPKSIGSFYTGLQNTVANTWAGPFQLVRDNDDVVPNYIPGQFMELSVNLSKLGIEPADFSNSPCGSPFRRVVIKTRSSTSFTAELKDFVAPFSLFNYPNVDANTYYTYYCGVMPLVTISVSNPNPSSIYTWSTPDGHIVGSNIGASITVDSPGIYYVSQQLHMQCSFFSADSVRILFDPICMVLDMKLQLNASQANNKNILQWQVDKNELTNEYQVEYSADNIHFSTLATLSSKTTTGNAQYEYRHDKNLTPYPVVYYRVIAKTHTGAAKYSNTALLRYGKAADHNAIIFPNPTKGKIFLSVKNNISETTNIFILNAAGKLVKESRIILRAGENIVPLDDISTFPEGVYFIKVLTSSGIITEKIILQK